MISMARGNELNTTHAHRRSLSPDVSEGFPDPAIEYARAATHRDHEQEQRSDRGAGGGRGGAPTILPGIRQGRSERRREPHEVEDRHAGDDCSDQNPRAVADIERDESVRRRADMRLIAVDDLAR